MPSSSQKNSFGRHWRLAPLAAGWLLAQAAIFPAGSEPLYTGTGGISAADVERVYTRGLQYLARSQNPGGDWPDSPRDGAPAITGLAVCSLLAHGDDPNIGPYSAAIHHGLDFILKSADAESGYIGTSMYNHAFATLALAESYGAVDDARIGPALQRAVRLILNAQKVNGAHAWRYSPQSQDADTTVSGAQMVALLAARNAGTPVPEEAVQNGLKFFQSCQTPDGGIGYISPTSPNSTRTAIACVVMALAKEKTSPMFKAAFTYLRQSQPDHSYAQYYLYYAAQAQFHGSPDAWRDWNKANFAALRASQTPDGNWEGQFGSAFGTATSLLSLALNYRYLPVYER